ncbi:hypothetical protein [Microvirga aerophila]|uniref:DUF5655 domain-containing protein n=1 Tax=Microvirga aerophila TaxID=670291 RepID=A0A512C4X4_9HYPH|nr:hypothetical protein [Microvirga aerophila]GEO19282.1 hypothetical protein MAE02_69780 [Microvirga aerophila]
MRTNVNRSRLALAQEKFEPIARVLDRLSEDVEKEHGHSAVLERRSAMQQTAQNAYAVRYSLQCPDEARLSLTFIVVGDDADLLLMQRHDRSDPRDLRANPGQVDQRVYRLEQIEEIKAAVQQKITAHFRARELRH